MKRHATAYAAGLDTQLSKPLGFVAAFGAV